MAKKRHNPPITLEDKLKFEYDKVRSAKNNFAKKYSSKIKKLSYHMSHGIGKVGIEDKNAPVSEKNNYCIAVLLQPLDVNQPDEISDELLTKIREEVLPKKYEGYRVFVRYIGRIIAA